MQVEWYWRDGSGTHGPVSEEDLIQLATDGQIDEQAEVRLGSDGRWHKAGRVKGLFSPIEHPETQPANSTTSAPSGELDEGDAAARGNERSQTVRLKRAKPLKAKVRPVSPVENVAAPPPVGSVETAATPADDVVTGAPPLVHTPPDISFVSADPAALPSPDSVEDGGGGTPWMLLAIGGCGLLGVGLAIATALLLFAGTPTKTTPDIQDAAANDDAPAAPSLPDGEVAEVLLPADANTATRPNSTMPSVWRRNTFRTRPIIPSFRQRSYVPERSSNR